MTEQDARERADKMVQGAYSQGQLADAIAAALFQAHRDGMEEAAKVAECFDTEFDLPDGVSKRRGDTARAIAQAIRGVKP